VKALSSERNRREFERGQSAKDQRQSIREFRDFVEKTRPQISVLGVEVRGTSARARMHISLLRADGGRITEEYYDDWLFENGDWFVDQMAQIEIE
jgi:hypothetical protein